MLNTYRYFHLQLLALLVIFHHVNGHGRLIKPPSRASAWRYGYKTPKDYNDNEGFCGGFENQKRHGMKCGICGDPYQGPRDHEAGGKYATATIVEEYTAGQVIDVTIDITANHDGWFYFKICPHNDFSTSPDQECFDQNPLSLADGSRRWDLPDRDTKQYNMKVKLPDDMTCSQCIFQWTYWTANSWGEDADGTECVGCGPQENFRACSDIAINPTGSNPALPQTTTTKAPVQPTPDQTNSTPTPVSTTTSTKSPESGKKNCKGINPVYDLWCQRNCNHVPSYCPKSFCKCSGGRTSAPKPGSGCKATGPWTGQTSMDEWCVINCGLGYCPASHCKCT